jgi:hypothetical protein
MKFFTAFGVFLVIILLLEACSKETKTQPNRILNLSKIVIIDKNGYRNDEIKPIPKNFTEEAPGEVSEKMAKNGQEIIKKYSWTNNGVKHSLILPLNPELAEKADKLPLSKTSESQCYAEAMKNLPGDASIVNIVNHFKNVKKLRKLSDKQLAEEVVAWVQSIPVPAENINQPVKRPLKTLIDGYGDCDDKSIIAYSILKNLGFGVALFSYPTHMALGIASSKDPSGYVYTETTTSFPIGEVPLNQQGKNPTLILKTSGKKFN